MTLLDDNDLVENPTTRVPIVFCLDTSGSMQGYKLDQLNKALNDFYEVLLADRTAKYAADACIVTFDSSVRIPQDFENVSHKRVPSITKAEGVTKLGEGINTALDCLEGRKQQYKQNGIEYFQPWLVLMTDGKPVQSSQQERDRAASRATSLEANRKLTVIPVYIGGDAEADEALREIGRYTNNQTPRRFDPAVLPELFRWISMSAASVANSGGGEEPVINFADFVPKMHEIDELLK